MSRNLDKDDARPLGQWTVETGSGALDDVRGGVAIAGKARRSSGKSPRPDSLVWITPDGLFEATLPLGSDESD